MKRWHVLAILGLATILIISGFAASWRSDQRKRAADTRQAGYQATVRDYSARFTPGTTRETIESSLAKEHVQVQTGPAYSGNRRGLEDTIKIGTEDPPWYCSRQGIYLVFEFDLDEHLERVTLSPRLEDCL